MLHCRPTSCALKVSEGNEVLVGSHPLNITITAGAATHASAEESCESAAEQACGFLLWRATTRCWHLSRPDGLSSRVRRATSSCSKALRSARQLCPRQGRHCVSHFGQCTGAEASRLCQGSGRGRRRVRAGRTEVRWTKAAEDEMLLYRIGVPA